MKKPEVKWRLVLPLQSKGDLGKSFEAESFCCYLEHRAIEWMGFDLDSENLSFSSRFPKGVKPVKISREPENDIIGLLKHAGEAKVTRWDVRAHMTDAVLEGLRIIRFPEHAATQGGRLTVVFFPQDNIDVLNDIDGIFQRLGANVDYLIVKNRFKSRETNMYDGSELEKDLRALGAGEMEMPVLLDAGKFPLVKLGLTLERKVSVAEAAKNSELGLDFTARCVLEDWLKRMYRGYDSNAHILLPSGDAAGIASHEDNQPAAKRRGFMPRIIVPNP
jgi:hypothetical protein